jgi:hypothetical protein
MPRPKFCPTEEQRLRVRSLAAFGVPQTNIAVSIGLRSPKTLRRHFRDELERAAHEANARVAQSLYQQASNGNITAAIFWLKSRAGWRETAPEAPRSTEIPPFLVAVEKDAV